MPHVQNTDKDEEKGKAGGQKRARYCRVDGRDFIEPRMGTHKDKER